MALADVFRPEPTLSEDRVNSGLRWLTWEGMASTGFGSIAGSGFTAAFALVLGANNLQIGMLASLPFLTMPLQILTVGLVERLRRRKLISVVAWSGAQALWIPVALIPVFLDVPSAGAVSLLIGLVGLRGMLVAAQNPAWNSWLRDLIPQQRMARFFARRLAYGHVGALVFGLGAALFVDSWQDRTADESQVFGYTIAILAGAIFLGMASPVFRLFVPEPLMQAPPGGGVPLLKTLIEPFKDPNYRRLMRFQLLWNLALHLAVPFFAVYMLRRLDLSISAVMAFSALSLATNVIFLRLWGPLADRVGSKAVLSVSASLYLLVVLGWTFTTMPDRHFLTIPLLLVLHVLAGAASAGVGVSSSVISMKLAPEGRATGYLAAMSVAASLGAGIGPLLGGRFIDFFSVRTFSLDFTWIDPAGVSHLPALSLTGYDFMFGITFLLGLMTLGGLAKLREEGEMSREVVLEALMAPMQRVIAPASSVPGLNVLAEFPLGYLRRVPVPGLDVALGVTAYQVAETARAAAAGAARGRAATETVAHAVEHAVASVWKMGETAEAHASEVARHAARGAVHAAAEVATDAGNLARHAVTGAINAFEESGVKTLAPIWGASYGVVQGAIEAGADPAEAARGALAAAKAAADRLGISQSAAVKEAAQAAMQAARELAARRLPEVRSAVERAVRQAEAQDGAGDDATKREDL